MFKFVNRSRSVKGRAAHGPESPVLDGDQPISKFQSHKQNGVSAQNQGMTSLASPSAASEVEVGILPLAQLHPSSSSPEPHLVAMPQRPSTSSGSGPSTSSPVAGFKDLDKRKSKDDLHLFTQSSSPQPGFQSYHFPIRGKPPTPQDIAWEGSPIKTASASASASTRTRTPESPDSGREIITIGMAIGSPTHPPPGVYEDWQPRAIGVATTSVSPEPVTESIPTPESTPELGGPTPQRQKSGRWKLFGRSKSKRQKPEPIPASSAMPSPPIAQAPPPPPLPPPSDADRINADRKQAKYKPIIVRSQTEPAHTGPAIASPEVPKQHRLAPRMTLNRARRGVEAEVRPRELSGSTAGSPGSPFLNVEIPDITMERYSVMFGGVLQTQSSSSALLARRHATVEKLRTTTSDVREKGARENGPRRRATSPNPDVASPSLLLFPPPPTPNINISPALSSPRLRSSTMPTGLPANPRPSVRDNKPAAIEMPAPKPKNQPSSSPQPRSRSHSDGRDEGQQEPIQPSTQISPRTQKGPVGLGLELPEDPAVHIKERLKPKIQDSSWQLVSKTESPKSATASPAVSTPVAIATTPVPIAHAGVAAPDTTQASSTPNVHKHVKKSSEERFDEEMALNAAVEISIARQISISQQQRHMLRQGMTGPSKRTRAARAQTGPAETSGDGSLIGAANQSPATSLNSHERLAATKSSTPTLVTPPDPYGGSPLAQHRKSEWVVLEGS